MILFLFWLFPAIPNAFKQDIVSKRIFYITIITYFQILHEILTKIE